VLFLRAASIRSSPGDAPLAVLAVDFKIEKSSAKKVRVLEEVVSVHRLHAHFVLGRPCCTVWWMCMFS